MRVLKRGFTLIEVSIFLAITGLLFIGITIGVQNSIYQQRFNDSVQTFAEFLRGVYSEVSNVQNLGGGRSDKAIYGRLVTFGQSYDQTGGEIKEEDRFKIYAYSVIGNIIEESSGTVLESLIATGSDVAFLEEDEHGKTFVPAGIVSDFTPKWAAGIENAEDFEKFVGALLIVRNPSSGTVYTYVLEGETIEVNHLMLQANEAIITHENKSILIDSGYLDVSHTPHFELKEVNFCVNPDPGVSGLLRRNIRIVQNARNSSGVLVVSDSESKCVR